MAETEIPEGYVGEVSGSAEEGFVITNVFVIEKTQVSVRTDWEDNNDKAQIRPQSIEVQLYADGEAMGSPVTLNEENGWSYSWSDLSKYVNEDEQTGVQRAIVYTVDETEIPEGYAAEVSGSAEEGFVITNIFVIEKTQVSVRTDWEDNNDKAQMRPQSIRVQLYADGRALGSPVTLDEENGWSYSWSDLTKYVYEGGLRAIEYTVDETEIPEGYVGEVSGSVEAGFVITNTYETGTLIIEKEFDIAPWEPFVPDDSYVDVPVVITWNDNNNADGNRPKNATVRLLANGTEVANAELNSGNGWRYTFTGMPRLDENREKIEYTITEDPIDWYKDQISGFNIRNNYEPELTEAAVKMIWDDADNETGTRPKSIAMTLSNGITVLLSDNNGWTATVKNLPTRLNGEPANYTWTEQKVAGYDKISEVTEGTLTTFVNKRRVQSASPTVDRIEYEFGEYEIPLRARVCESAAPTISITAGVEWDGDDDYYQLLRPESVQLILMGDGEPVGELKTVEASSWEATWYDLPAQNSDGNPIEYTVKQMEPISAYTTTCDGLTVTNTLKTGSLSVKISLSGVPEEADLSKLRLAIDGPDPRLEKTLTYEDVMNGTVDLGRVLEGAYMIRDTNADTLIEGYVMDAENSKVADAIYVSGGEDSELEFKYTWKLPEPLDAEADEDYDPFANIGDLSFEILGPDALMPLTIRYSDFTNGKYEIPDLAPGVYTVVERNAEKLVKYYTLTSNSMTGMAVEVKAGGTATAKLFNQYVPLPTPEPDAEFVDIPVTVTWNDNNNADGNRPESVTARLYADGVEVDSHVLTAAENWQFTFIEKPRHQEDNKTEIVYTVNEDAVPMYRAVVKSYSIVNEYEPELISASVSKRWNDNNNQQNLRPDSIAMSLLDGQKVAKVVVLSEANGWTAVVNDLPTVVNGQEAQYEWKEQQVNGYTLENVEQRGNHMTFTNAVWERPENNPTITPNNRTYDDTEKPLVTVSGELTGSTTKYALGSDAATAPEASAYTTAIPTATSAGTYYVWYKTEGDESQNDSSAVCVIVTISAKFSGGGGGGGGGGGSSSVNNPVGTGTFEGGSVKLSTEGARAGSTVTITVTPEEGYRADKVTVTDKNGSVIPVAQNADGTYRFTMPNSPVTVTPAFEKIADRTDTDVCDKFRDVSEDAWYHDAVRWAVDNGIMNGVASDLFDPDGAATRAMVVTMLWRLEGEPAGAGISFDDVPDGAWYAPAVSWAAQNEIIRGLSDESFDPDAPVTREQLAAILYRYAQSKGKGFTGAWAFPLDYSDAADVSEYAYEAMCFMTMNGVITGMDDGTLAPKDNATRAQIAAIFMRFCEETAG